MAQAWLRTSPLQTLGDVAAGWRCQFGMTNDEKPKRKAAYAKQGNGLKFCKFKAMPSINQKNYYTDYLKRDTQLLVNRNVPEDSDQENENIIVLELGSRNLRIGKVTDFDPKVFPTCVARKAQEQSHGLDGLYERPAEFDEALTEVRSDLKERMKFYKRKVVSNASDTVKSFNARQEGKEIVGETEAITDPQTAVCKLDVSEDYTLYWPITYGTTNEVDYLSPQSWFKDINLIISHAVLETVTKTEIGNHFVLLVIPSLYERDLVVRIIDVLYSIGFPSVALIQESVAATFGAGISTACVVNVGAQTCGVSCVDEGMCISDSRVNLKYGGDDVTVAFSRLLEMIKFPIDLDLRDNWLWQLADSLKEELCTASDERIAVQLEKCYLKRPGKRTLEYEFKVYNEIMFPVLGLFYPELFGSPAAKLSKKFSLFPRGVSIYDGHFNDPISDAQIGVGLNALKVYEESYRDRIQPAPSQEEDEASRQATPQPETAQGKAAANNAVAQQQAKEQMAAFESIDPTEIKPVALDHAIIESISQASAKSGTSEKTFYENLLVIGEGSEFAGFDQLLTDRLAMWNQKRIQDIGDPAVMGLPRELSASTVVWKGASVYAKLKIIDEMWIQDSDWAVLGSRVLQYKTLFAF